jgi:hypothetical protein
LEHNKWYHRTFLGQIREEFFVLFAEFFWGRKRGWHTSGSDMKLYEMNLEKKIWGILIPLRKIPNFKFFFSQNRVREVKL